MAAIDARVAQCHIKDNSRRAVPRQGGAAAFPGLIPTKPYCADYFDEGLRIRGRKEALKRRHVQFNGPNSFDWINFDVDRDEAYRAAEDANLPAPTIISINPANGHGLLSYLLKTPVHRFASSNRRPIEWLADVQRGYTRRLDADRSFHGVVMKNPTHCDWRTTWPTIRPYTLEDLDCALDRTDKRREPKAALEFGEGRNCTIFNDLRQLCYREATSYFSNKLAFSNRALELALAINQQFSTPLSRKEVAAIARSVTNWIARKFSAEAFSKIQRRRANRRWTGHVSAEATKPWVVEGISRRTWYRRKNGGAQ